MDMIVADPTLVPRVGKIHIRVKEARSAPGQGMDKRVALVKDAHSSMGKHKKKYKQYRLDLDAIEESLREVQENFEEINSRLLMRREPLTDEIIENLLAGYAYVDELLEAKVELFTRFGVHYVLELNHIVLCGPEVYMRMEYGRHVKATRDRFAVNIKEALSWHRRNESKSAYRRAAGVYVHMVSQPQLFFEGNHRTGALTASWLLLEDGKPPFVLTKNNAEAYFNPSTLIKSKHKEKLLDRRYFLSKYQKYFARFLEDHLDKRYRRKVTVKE